MNRLAHLLNQEQSEQFSKHHLHEETPIRRGCENEQCFCTGKCQEIIGWRKLHELEKRPWLGNMSKDEIKDGYDEVQRELKEKTDGS